MLTLTSKPLEGGRGAHSSLSRTHLGFPAFYCFPRASFLKSGHSSSLSRIAPHATKRSSNGASSRTGGFAKKSSPEKDAPAGHKGPASSSSSDATQTLHEKQEDLIRRRYFEELFTGGDYTVASAILDPSISHKDMVRDEHFQGIDEIVEYMRKVKEAYPGFFVRAVEIAPAPDGKSMFVAFEGHAAEGMPLFHGVDVFWFSQNGEKISEVNVYRSNWQGAQGHAQRKAKLEEEMRRQMEGEQRY